MSPVHLGDPPPQDAGFVFQLPGIARSVCAVRAKWLRRVRLFAAPWTAARQASLSITNSQSLLKVMSHRVGDAIQPSYPLSTPSPPAFSLPQHQGLFQRVSSSHQVAKVLSSLGKSSLGKPKYFLERYATGAPVYQLCLPPGHGHPRASLSPQPPVV